MRFVAQYDCGSMLPSLEQPFMVASKVMAREYVQKYMLAYARAGYTFKSVVLFQTGRGKDNDIFLGRYVLTTTVNYDVG